MAKLAIKSDNRKQNLFLPPSLDELVPENHMVRVVDAVIDRLDISQILSTYRGGGNSAFNPKMMLKVLVFAYLSNVYSSRRIEELLRRDIYFMWLSGMKRPDFRTINYYRGKRLKNGFDSVFTQVVELLHEEVRAEHPMIEEIVKRPSEILKCTMYLYIGAVAQATNIAESCGGGSVDTDLP